MARPAGLFLAILLALLFLLPSPCLAADKAAEPTADVTLDPDMDEGHRQFAHANYEKALEHYLKALERNKEDAYLHFRIGLTYYMLDNMENFKLYWSRAVEINHSVADELITAINTDYMMPTLLQGDTTVTDDKYFNYISHKHGDIIDYYISDKSTLANRIIGLPGDIIKIEKNILYRNDTPVDEKNVLWNGTIDSINRKQILVPEDCYYVLTDNRSIFLQDKYFGCVKKSKIIGKVLAIIASEEKKDGKSRLRIERFGLAIK
jgi:signal peptidase I